MDVLVLVSEILHWCLRQTPPPSSRTIKNKIGAKIQNRSTNWNNYSDRYSDGAIFELFVLQHQHISTTTFFLTVPSLIRRPSCYYDFFWVEWKKERESEREEGSGPNVNLMTIHHYI